MHDDQPAQPPSDQPSDGPDQQPDVLDVEAAHIDARDPDAAAEIEELLDHAEALGRDPDQDVDPDAP